MGGIVSRKKSGKRNDDLRIGTSTTATTSGKKGFFRRRRKRSATTISPEYIPTHAARASVAPPRQPPSPVPSTSSEHSEKLEISILDDPNMWFYIDTNGREQGPFSTEQMQYWHSRRFLPSDLKTRQATSPVFSPFADLFLGFLTADQAQQQPRPSVSFSTNAPQPSTSELSAAAAAAASSSLPSASSSSSPAVEQQPTHSPATASSSSSSLASSSCDLQASPLDSHEPASFTKIPEEHPEDQRHSSSSSLASASLSSPSLPCSSDALQPPATPEQAQPPSIPPPSLSTPSLVLPAPQQPFLPVLTSPAIHKAAVVTPASTVVSPGLHLNRSLSEQTPSAPTQVYQPLQKSISERSASDIEELQVDLQNWISQQPSTFKATVEKPLKTPSVSASAPNISARVRAQTDFATAVRPIVPPQPPPTTTSDTPNENDADLDNFFKTVSIIQIEEKPSYRHSMAVPLPPVHQHCSFRPQRPAPPPPSSSTGNLASLPFRATTPNRPPPQRPNASFVC